MVRSRSQRRTSAARIGVIAVASTLLVSATATPATAAKTAAANAKSTVTFALQSAPVSIDPVKSANGPYVLMDQLAYESLLDKDSTGNYVAGLAIKWGYTVPSKAFLVTLRAGVKFADGTPVTPAAVANSLNFFAKNSTGPTAGSFKDITATPKAGNKVLLTSTTPNPIIPELLTPQSLGGMIISPAGLKNDAARSTKTFGAGPYVYVPSQSVTGDHYTYVPNKRYYNQARIHSAKIVVKIIPLGTTALQAAISGQINAFMGDPSLEQASKSAGLKVSSVSNAFNGLFILDFTGLSVPELGKQQVRQAINFAIDRKAITQVVYGTSGTPTDQPNTPGWDAYAPALEATYSHNATKAKQLLAAAGAASFSFDLGYVSTDDATSKMVQAIAAQLGQVGVTANLKGFASFPELVTAIMGKKIQAFALPWGGQPQFGQVNTLWAATAAVNPFGGTVPGLEAAFNAYLSASDKTRVVAARAVQKILVDQAVSVPVSRIATLWMSSHLSGFKVFPSAVANNPADWIVTK